MTALDRYTRDNKTKLDKHNIEIHIDERMILYRDLAIPVPFGTTTSEIDKVVNKMCKEERARKAEIMRESLKRNQVKLF